MITKSQVKHIQLLAEKKYRHEQRLFVVEGEKMVAELLQSELNIDTIYALPEWIDRNKAGIGDHHVEEVKPFELERISTLKTPNKVVAIAKIPSHHPVDPTLALLLDDIQDPGNLGSIIRIADWYDVRHVFCSLSCVDAYNPKVVQSSMGSIFRIHLHYVPLKEFILKHQEVPVYAATLDGKDIGQYSGIQQGMILIGNESHGINPELLAISSYNITIPRKGHAESLNAAVATGIICHSLLS